jgi:hypothetical protein
MRSHHQRGRAIEDAAQGAMKVFRIELRETLVEDDEIGALQERATDEQPRATPARHGRTLATSGWWEPHSRSKMTRLAGKPFGLVAPPFVARGDGEVVKANAFVNRIGRLRCP